MKYKNEKEALTKSIATVTLYVALHPSKLNHLFNLMLPDLFMLVCSPHICTINQVVVHHTLVTLLHYFEVMDSYLTDNANCPIYTFHKIVI